MDRVKSLFRTWAGAEVDDCQPLSGSGSHRRYYRLSGGGRTVIAVVGTDPDENRAFLTIDRAFLSQGLPVPEVYAVSEDGMAYIQEDLGDVSLYDDRQQDMLVKTIRELPRLQYLGASELDFSVCYPDTEFNARMVDFDLNYFKYCFLKESGVEFNEVRLQDDFDAFKADLLSENTNTFMYRDFQARNVMVKDGKPYFIDFQGGRRGPVQYDLASFVWQVSADYPQELRQLLISEYIDALKEFTEVDPVEFRRKLDSFVLFRLLQVLGCYGFRGQIERKPYFLKSIPYALKSVRSLLPLKSYPYLSEVLEAMTASVEEGRKGDGTLTVEVMSFSFRKGVPEDASGNGGGYVFDCRALHNPGRYDQYKALTGRDPEVIRFLEERGEVQVFLDHAYSLVDSHVEKFISRGFDHMQVCFGCTGGQHRSVYCAEHMASHLREKYDVNVVLRHLEH